MQKEPQVPVRYIGLNENGYSDHLYGSGGVWPMQDSISDVPVSKAIKLLDHPEFEDAREDKTVSLKALLSGAPVVQPEKEEESEVKPPLVDLSQMTKAQLKEYAHRNFGIELPDTAKKDEMINHVRLQMGKAPQ